MLEREFAPITVTNSIFYKNVKGIAVGQYSPLIGWAFIDYCNFWENLVNYEGEKIDLGSHNIYSDPQFLNPTKDIFYLQPTSPCLKAGNVEDGKFQNIGIYGIGKISSWIDDSWNGWIDENGQPVTNSSVVEINVNGNIKLKNGITSASIRSPVIDTQKDTGKIRSITFVADEFPGLPSGNRQVVDYDNTTITREVRWRGSNVGFSPTDTLPEWQLAYKSIPIDGPAGTRYIQVEFTLRINAK